MSTIAGNAVDYLIERVNKESKETDLLIFAQFNGTFSATNAVDSATKYSDKTKAQKNVDVQNMLAEINELPFEYYVVERSITYSKLADDVASNDASV